MIHALTGDNPGSGAGQGSKRRGGERRGMNNRFYCPLCETFVSENELIRDVLPPNFSAARKEAVYSAYEVRHRFSHIHCGEVVEDKGNASGKFRMTQGRAHEFGNPPYFTPPDVLKNIIGSMPDLPDGFPREDNQQQGQERKEDE
jgi:hypothetical protein